MKLCFRFGLYKQGLKHDLSKYSWTELVTGAKYYLGYKSPNSNERDTIGYSSAWLHHKGRNKHHWEYWIDFTSKGIIAIEMPINYVVEMFCDRVAATMVYQGTQFNFKAPLDYYNKTHHYYVINENTDRISVSYTHLRAHETGRNLVCRLLLEKKKKKKTHKTQNTKHHNQTTYSLTQYL